MEYQYATKNSFEYLSSGRILYSAPGFSAFPVRLGSEITQRCFKILKLNGNSGPYNIYDPCCGIAYLLTILGFLHGNYLNKIYASDINADAINIAQKNLSLLNKIGMNKRIEEIEVLEKAYSKNSHKDTLKDTNKLLELQLFTSNLTVKCFQADITQKNQINFIVDIVITDFPYGKLENWQTVKSDPVCSFFDNIGKYLQSNESLLAVISDKGQKLNSNEFQKLQYFRVGKRQVSIFRKK